MPEWLPWVIAILLLLLLVWLVLRKGKGKGNRCPTCGVNRDKYPHKPRCTYWQDR